MPSPLEAFLEQFIEQQLELYKADLPRRTGSTKRPLAYSTITAREKGAEDFALFLLGKKAQTERIRGAIRSRRVK